MIIDISWEGIALRRGSSPSKRWIIYHEPLMLYENIRERNRDNYDHLGDIYILYIYIYIFEYDDYYMIERVDVYLNRMGLNTSKNWNLASIN